MSRGINKVTLIGNAGRDPEVRYTQNGMAVANFTLATTERVKRKDQWEDHTEWHNLVAWGKTAETCGQYVKKGTQVYVEGRLQTRKWQDKDGNARYTTEIVVNQLMLLGRSGGQRPESAGGEYHAPSPSSSRPAAAHDDFPGPPMDDAGFDPNDDVPF